MIGKRSNQGLQGIAFSFLLLPGCNARGPGSPIPDAGGADEREAGSDPPPPTARDACRPASCAEQGMDCGTVDDGCGETISCGGPCDTASDAGSTCEPLTCEEQGKDCGMLADGCGGEIFCGDCSQGACGAIEPNVCSCDSGLTATEPRHARRARSTGFSGSVEQYDELFSVACETASDCEQPCAERGGSEEMCAASDCLDDFEGGRDCLPAPVWRNLESIRFESEVPEDGVELTVVFQTYADVLIASDFAHEVPESARILGISVEIRRAGDHTVADDSIRIVKGGVIGTAERALPQAWGTELEWVSYGGSADLWGEEWTPADINAHDFGVAVSAAYTRTAGNSRAYVDQVRVGVHYEETGCE